MVLIGKALLLADGGRKAVQMLVGPVTGDVAIVHRHVHSSYMTYVKCAHGDGDGDGGVRPPHARQRHRPPPRRR